MRESEGMLLQFTVSNFRAFRNVQTLNLSSSGHDDSLPQNTTQIDVPTIEDQKWLRGIALYGANASGKSTILYALESLAKFVRHSAKVTDPKKEIGYIEPFALCGKAQEEVPTGFGVSFVVNDVRHEYRVAATKVRVFHESLRAFPQNREQVWFCRDYDSKSDKYTWSPDRPTGYKRDHKKEEYTLKNVLYLSKAVSLGDEQLSSVFRWFLDRLVFMDLSVASTLQNDYTSELFANESELAPKILKLLRHADLGLKDVRVNQKKVGKQAQDLLEKIKSVMPDEIREVMDESDKAERRITEVQMSHRSQHDTEDALLSWNAESAGTQRLFSLAGPWMDILKEGHIVCIDELEASMHPLMVRELLKLIFNDETNPKGAQILFTTHNPILLDLTLIRRDQIWFTDKDKNGESHLYPLTDYAPRKGESLVRGYLSGRYGGIPFIPQGLMGADEVCVSGGLDE